MKKKSFLVLATALLGPIMCSNTSARTLNEAYTVAQKALTTSIQVSLQNATISNGDTLYYTFTGNAGGFAIVSAKDETTALLAYNKYATIAPDGQLPEDLTKLLTTYFGNPLNVKKEQNAGKNRLKVSRLSNYTVEPLLGETAWGQDAPYNNNCPTIAGSNAPTGCVATAIAQMLHYYQYPSAVLADIPAYTTTSNSIAVGGVSKGTAINWDQMNDVYGDDYSTESANAVSSLMSMVGTALQMDYGTSESSCAKSGIKELATYFGYDAELAHVAYRTSFTLTEWYDLILKELQSNRPVMFSGSTLKSGHRFICDGIDANGLFHINWGWKGNYNGYYDLTLLNPDAQAEIGASNSKDGYTKDEFIVLGLTPDNGKTDDKPTSDVVSISVKHQVTNGFNYLFYTYANPYSTAESIYVSSGYVDENGNVVKIGGISLVDFDVDIQYSQQTASPLDVSNFKEGKLYKVGLIESEDGTNWKISEGYNNVNVVFTVKDGEVVVASQSELEAELEVTDFSTLGTYAYGKINLTNKGEQEYNDVIYLMTSSTTTNPMKYSSAAVITVEANGDNTLDVSFIPQSDTVYFWVMDNNLSTLKSGFVVKRNATYHLEATASFDTLQDGKIYCYVDVKNTGDTYYDADLQLSLLHSAGNTVVTHPTYIKAGDSTVVSFELSSEYNYTQYTISDYKGNIITYNQIENNKTEENTGELHYNLTFSIFKAKGDTVTGILTLNNQSATDISDDFIVLVGPSESSLTEIAFWETIAIPANSNSLNTFTTITQGDSLYFKILRGTTAVAEGHTTATTTFVAKNAASTNLKIWSEGNEIVVSATEPGNLCIYNVAGACLLNKSIMANELFRLPVKKGIYLVNGKKVVVM